MQGIIRPFIAFFGLGIYKRLRIKKSSLKLLLDENGLHRYVICLVHLLHQNGHKVHIQLCLTQSLLSDLHFGRNWKPYEAMLLRHPSVSFCFRRKGAIPLSSAYFSDFAKSTGSYRIPIGPHPNFLHKKAEPKSHLKKRVFWTGNHTEEYKRHFDTKLWNMPERGETIRHLKRHCPNVVLPKVSSTEFCAHLSNADFFICLPGMFMPLCHTLYEAISYLTIPICHSQYLLEVDPTLRAILMPFSWNTHSELTQLIHGIQQSVPTKKERMTRMKLGQYKKSILAPDFIEKQIRNSDHVFICAEEKSINRNTP